MGRTTTFEKQILMKRGVDAARKSHVSADKLIYGARYLDATRQWMDLQLESFHRRGDFAGKF